MILDVVPVHENDTDTRRLFFQAAHLTDADKPELTLSINTQSMRGC